MKLIYQKKGDTMSKDVVLGVDLGTSAVKVSAVDRQGNIVAQETYSYPLLQSAPGYSEQNPQEWVSGTTVAIVRLILNDHLTAEQIKGISFSGQMHGLVTLDKANKVIRPAILWNDTRATKQVQEINNQLGDDFLQVTCNRAQAGFTLPSLLWLKENETENFAKIHKIVTPKDYLRYRMTGKLQMEISDAAGTVALDVATGTWSNLVQEAFGLSATMFPEIIQSIDNVGPISDTYAEFSGLSTKTQVIGGAADNAAGAVGAAILKPNMVMSSIGTSGVVLKYEDNADIDYHGKVTFFNHAIPHKYYSMGVTLSAGYSLSWFKKTFASDLSFDEMVALAQESTIGAHGLIFTPYIVGERGDGDIRGSFIGVDGTQTRSDFVRAVLEGIIYSFKDLFAIYENTGSNFETVVAIGGGAKSALWLQIQADIFNTRVVALKNEQGPGMGAAILAAVGLGWFESVQDAANTFTSFDKTYEPNPASVAKYDEYYQIYKRIYTQTAALSHDLLALRRK